VISDPPSFRKTSSVMFGFHKYTKVSQNRFFEGELI
jgi:hypothetical protein